MSKLYIVGTPIGNLKDITYRAVETLKSVDVIACEDIRVSLKLLNHYEIRDKKLIAYHDHNERKSAKGIIELIKSGKSVAQISDAGMPVINDPGYTLIREAIAEDIDIEVIPGPSAPTVALVLSNFDSHYSFHGFFKYKTQQRKNQLAKLTKGTHIFLASPHRIINELSDIKEELGGRASVFIARELTKKFERHYRDDIDDVIEELKTNSKGEYTIVISIKKELKNGK